MGKLQVFDGKQTNWVGLWWHPENMSFSSSVISLSELRKFKGKVRLYVRKNKFFNGGENGRPNYNFSLRDAESDNAYELTVCDCDEKKRLYTYEECEEVMRKSWEYAAMGYPYGHFNVDDFV